MKRPAARISIVLSAIVLGLLLLLGIASAASPLLRPVAENILADKLDRPVTLQSLHLNLLSLTPSARLGGLHIPNASWAQDNNPLADIETLQASVKLLPLLAGDIIIPDLQLANAQINLARNAQGRANWTDDAETDKQPLGFPDIRHFALTSSTLTVTDALRNLNFAGRFSTEEGATDGRENAFTLSGTGNLNRQPFTLEATGGELLGRDPSQPYPFKLTMQHGATSLVAEGTLRDNLSPEDIAATFTLTGSNLADLYDITGLALPITRPYKISGSLDRDDHIIALTDLQGNLGESDISGDLKVDTSGEKPKLTGSLTSKLLAPEDAGIIFGTPPASDRILPDKPFAVERFRAMDADVDFRATDISITTLPLRDVTFGINLKDGLLTLDPFNLTLPQGRVTGTLAINAQQATPQMTIDAKLSGARLQDFMKQVSQTNIISGSLVARVKLSGAGNSVKQAASNADGTVTAVIPNGELRQAFAELIGINLARGLGMLLVGDTQPTPIRCAIAHFDAAGGTLTARNTVLSTGVVTANVKGTINLGDESLDLTVKGEPTGPRLVRLGVPVKVTGTLRKPKVGLEADQAATQAAAATALGVALTPLAAILPFVDLGEADAPDCRALLQDAKQSGGAPLTITPTAP